MSIVYFGSPEFAVTALVALLQAGEDISAVVTQPDKRRGRGGATTPSPVKAEALKRGLRVMEPASMRDEGFLSEMEALKPEFLVVAAFGKILPKRLLDLPRIAPVNIHASLLPKYRGASPVTWAIIEGEAETGVTTMLMSEGLDEGDILMQEKVMIEDTDTTETLTHKLALLGGPLTARTLKALREGTLTPRPQTGASTYARMLKKADGLIDWSLGAERLHNFIRGMQPWPGAYTALAGKRVIVLKSKVSESPAPASKPGTLISTTQGEGFTVATGKASSLSILEVQPEGKRAMSASEFLRGQKVAEGSVLA